MTITADDVDLAVTQAVATLSQAIDQDWSVKAGQVDWTCWETAEHIADDLFAYALQLGLKQPPHDANIPVVCESKREGGPASSIFADPGGKVPGLLQVLESCGALLTAMVRVTPPTMRSFHGSGMADPEGFGAMGIVEVLLHTQDIAAGLGLTWQPDDGLCGRVLQRLFPDAPTGSPHWQTLLWCSGRGDLPGLERRTSWKWNSNVTPDLAAR